MGVTYLTAVAIQTMSENVRCVAQQERTGRWRGLIKLFFQGHERTLLSSNDTFPTEVLAVRSAEEAFKMIREADLEQELEEGGFGIKPTIH